MGIATLTFSKKNDNEKSEYRDRTKVAPAIDASGKIHTDEPIDIDPDSFDKYKVI
ncbi:hypothetical protein OQX61_23055 [Pedobacter sp. PLR]|uniref:hypothetical protein n=1 Tax=Pedobacter sp. PLR TaxID=2994465 RepID=UPI00224703B8|nr:hypothetical protein [Pedobacter sp. PLR]MCX2454168.1 hypothetical protein [Pedobacter sp. PLR]